MTLFRSRLRLNLVGELNWVGYNERMDSVGTIVGCIEE